MSLDDIQLADGLTPCPRCGERPPYKDPWARLHTESVIWPRVCLDCALRYDCRLQASTDE